ncbi:MAG: calcium/sodium antiporter [Clostridia bacterium]|nr:calcium/sodium antiporter [Clostridia bacterium]
MSGMSLLASTAGTAVLQIFLLLVGFVLLVKGADFFVDGASGIAKKLKVSTFIIGVTVVALGTSAPEAAVTIVDAVNGSGELIVGNIMGSNIINVLLILGVSAVICKLPVEKTTRFIDLPFLVFTSALFVVLGCIGWTFEWWEGLILLLLYCSFMAYNIVLATRQSKVGLEQAAAVSVADINEVTEEPVSKWQKFKAGYENLQNKVWFLIILTIAGLGMVVGGAQLVVNSAQYIAEDLIGIEPEIVALTVVAFGTSLPELVTSVSAARKGDVGIATGNIIGSNIANILLIGGLGAVCSKGGLLFSTEGLISGLVSLAAAILIFVCSFNRTKSLTRVAGIIMLVGLVCYYCFVFVNYYALHLY